MGYVGVVGFCYLMLLMMLGCVVYDQQVVMGQFQRVGDVGLVFVLQVEVVVVVEIE